MIHNFRAEIRDIDAEAGTLTARLVPFGVQVPYRGNTVSFRAGGLTYPETVALTVDHGDGVLDRVGVMTRHFETEAAAFAEFKFAETTAAQDLRELVRLGAVTDVSIGVEYDGNLDGDVEMTGRLDHVSMVSHGRFSKTDDGAKVLAVHHDEKGSAMDETTPDVAEMAEPYDDAPIKAAFVGVTDRLEALEATAVTKEPAIFAGVDDWALAVFEAGGGDADATDKLAKFALAAETTTTGAGVVPDFLSTEYLSIIATSRAFLGAIRNDPIGTSGMSVVYPKKTSGPSVAVQATENLEVDSTAMPIATLSVDLLTYAGANKVSRQLAERSVPNFIDLLLQELSGQYAIVTDAASIAAAVAAADDTAILADLGADAAATFAAFALANTAIIAGTRRPADTVFLAPDRWAQLNSLVDTDGRPLLVFGPNNPTNSQGQSSFATTVAQYHGWIVRLDPDAATGTCLIANTEHLANLESSPVSLSVLHVDTLSTDIGIWGLQNVVVKFDTALYTLTLA